MTTNDARALFPPGYTHITPGARDLLAAAGVAPATLLARHVAGDWGAVPPEDARENALSLRQGFRLVSSYPVGDDPTARVWIITEADRSATLLLLPSEYCVSRRSPTNVRRRLWGERSSTSVRRGCQARPWCRA